MNNYLNLCKLKYCHYCHLHWFARWRFCTTTLGAVFGKKLKNPKAIWGEDYSPNPSCDGPDYARLVWIDWWWAEFQIIIESSLNHPPPHPHRHIRFHCHSTSNIKHQEGQHQDSHCHGEYLRFQSLQLQFQQLICTVADMVSTTVSTVPR